NAARRSAEYIRGPACAPDRPTGNRRLYGNSRGYGYQWAAVRFSCRTADAFHRPARRFFPGPPRLIPGVRSTVILAVDNQPQTRIAAATGWPTPILAAPRRIESSCGRGRIEIWALCLGSARAVARPMKRQTRQAID